MKNRTDEHVKQPTTKAQLQSALFQLSRLTTRVAALESRLVELEASVEAGTVDGLRLREFLDDDFTIGAEEGGPLS